MDKHKHFSTTISEPKIKSYLNEVAMNNKKDAETKSKIFLQYYLLLLNNHQYLDLKLLGF